MLYILKTDENGGLLVSTDSSHPIQPVLIGDPIKTSNLVKTFKKILL